MTTAHKILRQEGISGFWRGNALNVLRTAPFKACGHRDRHTCAPGSSCASVVQPTALTTSSSSSSPRGSLQLPRCIKLMSASVCAILMLTAAQHKLQHSTCPRVFTPRDCRQSTFSALTPFTAPWSCSAAGMEMRSALPQERWQVHMLSCAWCSSLTTATFGVRIFFLKRCQQGTVFGGTPAFRQPLTPVLCQTRFHCITLHSDCHFLLTMRMCTRVHFTGITATVVCFPLDVVRTRLMARAHGLRYGNDPFRTLAGIVKYEGPSALYTGQFGLRNCERVPSW